MNMNPWLMLEEAVQDPNVPFKVEVGEYSIARKPAAKGKSGEPADNPNMGKLPGGTYTHTLNKGGQPYLQVPPAERQRYLYDNRGVLWDMLSGQPAQKNVYDRRDFKPVATPTPLNPNVPSTQTQEVVMPDMQYKYKGQ